MVLQQPFHGAYDSNTELGTGDHCRDNLTVFKTNKLLLVSLALTNFARPALFHCHFFSLS